MDSRIVQKAKDTAVLTGVLVCMFAPLCDEGHDWNAPLTEIPGSPPKYSNRTRNIKRVSIMPARRNKRSHEVTQNPAGAYHFPVV